MERYEAIFSEENRREIIVKCLGCEHFEIVQWNVEPFSDNVNGFLGEHLRGKFEVVLANGEHKKSQVFIKVKPVGSNEEMTRLASEAHAYGTEAFYLSKLLENENQIEWAPRLIFAIPDVVVFEDLSLKNFILSKVAFGDFDLEHCTVFIKALAQFHAFNFSWQEKFESFFEKHSDYLTEALFNLDETKLSRAWTMNGLNSLEAIIDLLPENYHLNPQEFKRLLREKFLENIHVVAPSTKYTNVICHGDLWMKNMLFKYDENSAPITCCILDFQILRYAPPISDVIEFLFINTSHEFRRRNLHYLLKFYHEKLEKNLKQQGCTTRISYDELYASAQEQIDFFKIGSVFYKSVLEMGDRYINELMKVPGAYQDLMFYNRTPFILDNYQQNPQYRAKVIDWMIEIREMLTEKIVSRENTWGIIQRCFGRSDFKSFNLKTVPMGSKLGYLGDHYNLLLSVNLDGKVHDVELFLKGQPKSRGSLLFLSESGGFDKETYFYGNILGAFSSFNLDHLFNAAVPRCYWYCPEKYLIFENLISQGFRALDKYKKIDFPIAKAMMVTFAKFHTASYVYEEKMSQKLNRSFRIDQEFTIAESYYVYNGKDLHRQFIENTTEGLLLEIDLLLDANVYDFQMVKEKVKNVTARFPDFVKPMSNIRNVICNGDLWANNVMVCENRGAPLQCRLVDFQTWRYSSPAHDIVTFLHFTSTESFRARYTQKLLEIYYQILQLELQNYEIDVTTIVTMDQLESSYNELSPFAAAQAAIFDQFIMIGADNINELFEEDRPDLIYGDRVQIIADNCRTDAKYKRILTESIKALCNTL